MPDRTQQGCACCRADEAMHGMLCYSCWSDAIEDEIEVTEGNDGREECERGPDRMTHEGREYYRLADGVELIQGDHYKYRSLSAFGPISWPRYTCPRTSGDRYWRPVALIQGGGDRPAFTSDRPRTVRALAKAHGHNLSRVRSQTHVVDSLTGKRLDTEQARDSSVSIPKDLAKLVLSELSPQWHTKAVRELLRVIEGQL